MLSHRRKQLHLGSSWLLVALIATLVGCGLEYRPNYRHDVEIAPNRWLTLQEKRGKCWFFCNWNGKRVFWGGKRDQYDELELPVTLREHEGSLYLIALNRENMEAIKYVYFRLNKAGDGFVEILPREFPKSIATENMVGPSTRFIGVGNQRNVDTWAVLRKLDVEHPYFSRSMTADVWIELETGLNRQQIEKAMRNEERQRLIRYYAEKYKPVPLPTLVKE